MNNAADTHTHDSCCPEEAAAYLDGELSNEAGARFEQHARVCSTCAEVLNEQRRLTDTQLTYIDAQADVIRTWAEVERATGGKRP